MTAVVRLKCGGQFTYPATRSHAVRGRLSRSVAFFFRQFVANLAARRAERPSSASGECPEMSGCNKLQRRFPTCAHFKLKGRGIRWEVKVSARCMSTLLLGLSFHLPSSLDALRIKAWERIQRTHWIGGS